MHRPISHWALPAPVRLLTFWTLLRLALIGAFTPSTRRTVYFLVVFCASYDSIRMRVTMEANIRSHFVDAIWLPFYVSKHLSPLLLRRGYPGTICAKQMLGWTVFVNFPNVLVAFLVALLLCAVSQKNISANHHNRHKHWDRYPYIIPIFLLLSLPPRFCRSIMA